MSASLTKRIDLVLDGQLRFGGRGSTVVTRRGSAGLGFKLNKYFTLTPGYVYQIATPLPESKTVEHRLTLTGTVKVPLRHFTFTDYNLFERRLLNARPDSTRYRNRLRVEHPISIREVKVVLFLSDEVYYDWSVHEWARNRFYAGVGKEFTRHLSGEVFYLKQNDSHVHPGDLSALGIVIRLRL